VPHYSTLNNDVIPQKKLLDQLDLYQPKFDTSLLKEILATVGMQSIDERTYKIISIMMEAQLLKILQEVRSVT